jgi:hydroxyethylthiazole kinase-like uncharacterized protein yjeF
MKALTKQQMATLDAAMVKMGIDVPRMMELAGLFTALAAAGMLHHKKQPILALSGTGNNGGDALVAARHLLNWGYRVNIAFASPQKKLKSVPTQQWRIVQKMGAKETKKPQWSQYALIIDGLLGYNLKGNPKGRYAGLIRSANSSGIPILAIDLPSGLDATSGKAFEPCIRAAATLALTAPKKGTVNKKSKPYVGNLYTAYMTVPAVINKKFGLRNPFTAQSLIQKVC